MLPYILKTLNLKRLRVGTVRELQAHFMTIQISATQLNIAH